MLESRNESSPEPQPLPNAWERMGKEKLHRTRIATKLRVWALQRHDVSKITIGAKLTVYTISVFIHSENDSKRIRSELTDACCEFWPQDSYVAVFDESMLQTRPFSIGDDLYVVFDRKVKP